MRFNEYAVHYYFTGAVSSLEINGSYTTSFQCADGGYALIRGDNLTLEYNYGHNQSEVSMTLSTIISQIIFSYPVLVHVLLQH